MTNSNNNIESSQRLSLLIETDENALQHIENAFDQIAQLGK
jgi:hypothetical protein